MKKMILTMIAAVLLSVGISWTCFGTGGNRNMEVSVLDGKIIVSTFGDFGGKDWIGIYKPGETPGTETASIVWWYTGEKGGTVTLPDDMGKVNANRADEFIDGGKLRPGEYVIIALADDGYGRIEEIEPEQIVISPNEADIAIDYDASSFIDSEFQQIHWNGSKLNDYENGESPRAALKNILDPDGIFDDAVGKGLTLKLEGWVGFEQDIVAFGSIVNSTVAWSDAFDKGSNSDIRSEDKGGRYAKQYSVEIDISGLTGEYTAGVIAALADGTLVKLNSTAEPEKNTFISFIGPEPKVTATPEVTPTPTPGATDAATDAPSTAPTDQPPVNTDVPATEAPTDAADDETPSGGTGDNDSRGEKGPFIWVIVGIIAVLLIAGAAILIVKGKKK